MEGARSLLQDITSLERQLQDIITKRELMGMNNVELQQQQEALQNNLVDKKRALRLLTEPGSEVERRQRALISNGLSLHLLEEIAVLEDRLCAVLPITGVTPLEGPALGIMDGPTDPGDIFSFGDGVCACALSTYPRMPASTERQGDPVCDRYKARIYANGAVLALADGCNWGRLPYEAAIRASDSFVDFLCARLGHITTIRSAGPILLAALSHAHASIVEGNDLYDTGTTTLIGGVLVQVAGSNRWAFVCVSLGDCKAFHYAHKTRDFTDITQGNRRNLTDARDPGGRLGPYVGVGQPDLRNLRLYHQIIDPGDLIFLVSDGVHDNLDPQQLGTTPSEADVATTGTWEEAEKTVPNAVEAFKHDFRQRWLRSAFTGDDRIKHNNSDNNNNSNDNNNNDNSNNNNNNNNNNDTHNTTDNKLLPQTIVEVLFRHAIETTRPSRDWMESHPNKRLPQDFKAYPGKMDHLSCVCYRAEVIDANSPRTITTTGHITVDITPNPNILRAGSEGDVISDESGQGEGNDAAGSGSGSGGEGGSGVASNSGDLTGTNVG